MSARSVSRWLLTDTYSPSAIDAAPATSPAMCAMSTMKIAPTLSQIARKRAKSQWRA